MAHKTYDIEGVLNSGNNGGGCIPFVIWETTAVRLSLSVWCSIPVFEIGHHLEYLRTD